MDISRRTNILNELLAKCYDSEKGYKQAAEMVASERLQKLFRDYAKQRYEFGHDIKDHLRRIGGDIDKGDTLTAKAHRAWMNLKSTISSNNEEAILEEVKRGEENALNTYREAIEKFPEESPAHDLLINQRNNIRASMQRIDSMLPQYETS